LGLRGPFRLQENELAINESVPLPLLQVMVMRSYYDGDGMEIYIENASQVWQLDVVYPDLIDATKDTKKKRTFELSPIDPLWLAQANRTELSFEFTSSIEGELPLQLNVDESPIYKRDGVIYAAVVLCGLYVMIIWEIVNRTFAAIIASTLSVGILAALNSRPSMATIMGWIDVETLLLLFGMMILVAILSETGVFDYLALFLILLIFVFRYLTIVIELRTFVLELQVLLTKPSNLSKLDEYIFFEFPPIFKKIISED